MQIEAFERSKAARKALSKCNLCPRGCGVDRTRGQKGFCGIDDAVRCFREMLFYGEESELVPSHQIYLTGCNLRCEFCNVTEWNQEPGAAAEMDYKKMAETIARREELRLPSIIEDFTRLTSGLILITGPTGSGKTTTMNFMIDLINSERRCKIIAIEDPVEYIHRQKRAVIIQQELHTDVKSFSSALVHVLRQNPDVICIGEMRDLETTETALIAAETGHLVIATCHTPNAFQTVERIVSIFPERQQPQIFTQLANCLQGVLAQRLVPLANKKGRVLATELLIVNAAARKHIREHELHQLISVIQMGRKKGMYTMEDSLFDLYETGEITYETAMCNSSDPAALRSRIHGEKRQSEE